MKSPEMQRFCDELAKSMGWDGNEKNCRTCNSPVGDFKDELSIKEFMISGMCQNCQDEMFGAPEIFE